MWSQYCPTGFLEIQPNKLNYQLNFEIFMSIDFNFFQTLCHALCLTQEVVPVTLRAAISLETGSAFSGRQSQFGVFANSQQPITPEVIR